jgi:hypothetical protein
MKVNINQQSFVAFLENVTETIVSSVNVENYFSLPQDKKMNVLYVVFKLMKNSLSSPLTYSLATILNAFLGANSLIKSNLIFSILKF